MGHAGFLFEGFSGTELAVQYAMAKWKLSAEEEKAREAAFEARLMAELHAASPQPQPLPPPPPAPVADGIHITVTDQGQTTRYDSLTSVPLPVRQRIMNAWMTTPAQRTDTPVPPVVPRARTRGTAMAMNLFLPGAGQFYYGQPGWGCFYAVSFLACFAAMIVILIRGYFALNLSGDILAAGTLEKLMETFHAKTLIALQVVALAIYLASTAHLFLSRPRD